tara:strand:+ start:2226 stop:2798 length:573 start_codon:yes stop_codon:yes gene_type:complete
MKLSRLKRIIKETLDEQAHWWGAGPGYNPPTNNGQIIPGDFIYYNSQCEDCSQGQPISYQCYNPNSPQLYSSLSQCQTNNIAPETGGPTPTSTSTSTSSSTPGCDPNAPFPGNFNLSSWTNTWTSLPNFSSSNPNQPCNIICKSRNHWTNQLVAGGKGPKQTNMIECKLAEAEAQYLTHDCATSNANNCP